MYFFDVLKLKKARKCKKYVDENCYVGSLFWNAFSAEAGYWLVCYTAVFSVVTQRSSWVSGEERCVTTLKTAV